VLKQNLCLRLLTQVCCILTLLQSQFLRAQDNSLIQLSKNDSLMLLYGDHNTVSIATGAEKPIYLAPSVASIITAEDILATGATTLEEALVSVPGLHISLSFNRLNPIYSFRGIHTGANPQVLLLLNGVPLRQLFSGSRPNSLRMPVSNIERIEVIRGPGSAVYGADAFSGVINIITHTSAKQSYSEVVLKAGSFDREGGWINSFKQLGNWDLQFNFDSDKSNGDRGRIVKSDLQTALDNGFGTNASKAPGPLETRYNAITSSLALSNQNWNFDLWLYKNEDAGVGPGAAQVLDPKGRQDTTLYLFDMKYTSDNTGDWRFETQANYYYGESKSHFVIFPEGTRVLIDSDGNIVSSGGSVVDFPDGIIGAPVTMDQQTAIEFRTYYKGWQDHQIRLAAGAQKHKLTAKDQKNFGTGVIDGSSSPVDGTLTDVSGTEYAFIKDQERTVYHLSFQDEWKFLADWELTYGARADEYSDFGTTVNPRLAVVWSSSLNFTTKYLYGRAFRAPSFNELYAINNPAILGNPKLKPEVIDTMELVFDYHQGSHDQLQLSLFKYEVDDLIQYVIDSNGTTSTAQNTAGIEGYGYELENRWHIAKHLHVNASYSWQLSRYKDTGHIVNDAPQQRLYFNPRWEVISDWHLGLEAYRVFNRKRAINDKRSEIDDYTWVNLTLRYQRSKNDWVFTSGIKNLTDEDAREPSNGRISDDYPLEGQSLYIETGYRW